MKLKCLIIDDEPLARKGLQEYIDDIPYLETAGSAETSEEARVFLLNKQIDLLFLDIQMPGLTGIEFLKNEKPAVPVVICSAYSQYAIEGYDYDVLDYLVKPVAFDRFTQAAEKARYYHLLRAGNLGTPTQETEVLFIKSNQQMIKISFSDIKYIEAAGNYVVIHTHEKKMLVYITLKVVEEKLPTDRFIKVHKSFIVPLDKIESIREEKIILGNTFIPVGRSFKKHLWFQLQKKALKR